MSTAPLRFLLLMFAGWVNRHHLRRAISEFVEHYHLERTHQGLDNRLITTPTNDNHSVTLPIARRERLGGLLSFYYRAAS